MDETDDFTVTLVPYASLDIYAYYELYLRAGTSARGNDKDFSTGSAHYQWSIKLPEGVNFTSELGANYQSLATVPLPASWGFMMIGFSLLGVMKRKKAKYLTATC